MTINYREQKPKKTNKQTCSNKTVDTSANCATLTFKSRHTKLPTNLVVLLLKDSNLKIKLDPGGSFSRANVRQRNLI